MPKFKVTRTDGPHVLQITVAGATHRSSINAPNVIEAPDRKALEAVLAKHRCTFRVREVGQRPAEAPGSLQDAPPVADDPTPAAEPQEGQERPARKRGKPSDEG